MEKEIYIVKNIKKETKDVVTISFVPENGEGLVFVAGQFIKVGLFENPNNLSAKPYSISSSPKDKLLSISAKKVGAFSSALHELIVGDKVEISGAFGRMTIRDTYKSNNLVFIAGGIGIAPLYSMIKDLHERGDTEKQVYLFYSNKTKEDVVFNEQLKDIESKWQNFHFVNILTQEPHTGSATEESHRFDVGMLKKRMSNISSANYFICGTVSFVIEISKTLEDENIPTVQISAELFY